EREPQIERVIGPEVTVQLPDAGQPRPEGPPPVEPRDVAPEREHDVEVRRLVGDDADGAVADDPSLQLDRPAAGLGVSVQPERLPGAELPGDRRQELPAVRVAADAAEDGPRLVR